LSARAGEGRRVIARPGRRRWWNTKEQICQKND
jgi:hypothetical protein